MQPLLHAAAVESPSLPAQAKLQPYSSGETKPPSSRPPRFFLVVLVTAWLIGAVLWVGVRRKAGSTRALSHEHSGLLENYTPMLRLKGTTEAVQSRAILAPLLAGQQMETLTLTRLVPGGSRVKRGDLLAEFDRQAQMRDVLDKQADYAKLADQVLEEQAKENAARAKDETEVKQADDNLLKTDLEMQKVEILSRIDAEKAQENLDQAKATLQQLRETFDLKRKAAAAAIHILEIQRDRTHEAMLHAQANADLMQIRSPLDGVVVLNTIWKQGRLGEVQDGDQVRPGVSFMQVVDPSVMQVSVPANQEDFFNLHVGQTAKVHLDAYPELTFPGRLEQIAPMARSGGFSDKLRSFAVLFSVQGNDTRLMPDLSAAVDVDIGGQRGKTGTSQ